MRALYVEGLATHGDPESCVDVREDGGEALTGCYPGPLTTVAFTR